MTNILIDPGIINILLIIIDELLHINCDIKLPKIGIIESIFIITVIPQYDICPRFKI